MSVVCAKIYFHVLFITITGNYSLTTHQHYCTTKSCRAGFVQVLCCWLGERCAVSPHQWRQSSVSTCYDCNTIHGCQQKTVQDLGSCCQRLSAVSWWRDCQCVLHLPSRVTI